MELFGRGLAIFVVLTAAYLTASAAGPDWAFGGFANIAATVREIKTERDTVLVKIDTARSGRLPIGTVCKIYRGETFIADAMVVEAAGETSVAKVLSTEAVLSGDKVYIKRQPDSQ